MVMMKIVPKSLVYASEKFKSFVFYLDPQRYSYNFHFCMESPLAGRVCTISQGIHVTISNITLA